MEHHSEPPIGEHITNSTNSSKRRRVDDNPQQPDSKRLSIDCPPEDGKSHGNASVSATNSPYLVVHRVRCGRSSIAMEDHNDHPEEADFRDAPRLFAGDSRGSSLRGLDASPKIDPQSLVEEGSRLKLVVIRFYDCERHHQRHRSLFQAAVSGEHGSRLPTRLLPWFYQLKQDTPLAIESSESLTISQALSSAIEEWSQGIGQPLDDWDPARHLNAPYDYFYHSRHSLKHVASAGPSLFSTLDVSDQFHALLSYIESSQAASFDKADTMFASGKVDSECFSKLFTPHDTVVTTGKDGNLRGYSSELLKAQRDAVVLSLSSWEFNGSFYQKSTQVTIPWSSTKPGPISISSLPYWPLRWAHSSSRESLIGRGKTFWACRKPIVVGYNTKLLSSFDLAVSNPRYIIDYDTFQQLHPDGASASSRISETEMRRHGIDVGLDEQSDEFYILLPSSIRGFAFHDKKLRDLDVADIVIPVPWNTKAFDLLALAPQKRRTIEDLVLGHEQEQRRVDLVDDKGKGLVMLLHGPPGTGKTLTAETVAEHAQKPLYRVTCGDIGTDPTTAEEYLEKVLRLGSKWNCVVLLDEADVFLEERRSTDLSRNAFVSVFLRALEYYDGILILTTNRVGIFDEAFTSRIQMAIHYPRLNRQDREKVWRSTLNVLKDSGFEIEHEAIENRIGRLADHELNGRQIRNILWSASQVAKRRGKALHYDHLEGIMSISAEFQDYLIRTRGISDEENASMQRMRAEETGAGAARPAP